MNSGGRSCLLDGRISSTPIPHPTRQAIVTGFFRANQNTVALTGQQSIDEIDTFFDDWYEEQCDAATGHVCIQSQQDVLHIVALLQEDRPRADVLSALAAKHGKTELLQTTVDFVARLWLTISVGCLQHAFIPGSTITWEVGKLSNTIEQTFKPTHQLSEPIKLPKSFSARNLERIGGIEIEWTSNLADHLSLKDEDTKVMIYHQASILELHKRSGNSVIPEVLIDETLSTLALLIPSTDKPSQAWFHKNQKELHLDSRAGTYGPLNAAMRQSQNFHYWRERLEILKQTFDESEPHTISLWWNDDRKKVQWYTFWVAALVLLLTIFFGLVTSVSGIVQAWAAVSAIPG